jgi:hypothetical protein
MEEEEEDEDEMLDDGGGAETASMPARQGGALVLTHVTPEAMVERRRARMRW